MGTGARRYRKEGRLMADWKRSIRGVAELLNSGHEGRLTPGEVARSVANPHYR